MSARIGQSRPSREGLGRSLVPAAMVLSALILILIAVAPAAFSQQDGEQDRLLATKAMEAKILSIADKLRCPTCQGLSVRDSEAPLSRQIHDKVRRMVMEGQSEEAIKAFFVSRYGEWILRSPKKEGLGLVVWALPGVAILITGGLLGWRVYRNTHASNLEEASMETGLTEEQRMRISRDLKRYEDQD